MNRSISAILAMAMLMDGKYGASEISAQGKIPKGKISSGSKHHKPKNAAYVESHGIPTKHSGSVPKGCKIFSGILTVEHREYLYEIPIEVVYGTPKALNKSLKKHILNFDSFIKTKPDSYLKMCPEITKTLINPETP